MMRIVSLLMADLNTAPLGHTSRLADEMRGVPVIRRTIARVQQARRAGRVIVCCLPRDADGLRALLQGMDVCIHTFDTPAPYASLVRHARHWGMDSWRGGIGGMCWFDEEAHVAVAAAVAAREQADGIMIVPASACLIVPELIDAMCDHFARVAPLFHMTFCTSPPGMTGAIFEASFLRELAPTGQPPGTILAYRPDAPAPDLTGKDACYRPPAIVAETSGRLLADTALGWKRLEQLIDRGAESWSAEQIAEWMRQPASGDGPTEYVLRDIEIELTTDDQLSQSRARPRGACVPRRGALSAAHLQRITAELRHVPDVRIMLGGFGEPLLHPELPNIVRAMREAGALSIAIRTNALTANESVDEALFSIPVDAMLVTLDAATPEVYRKVHGMDGYDRAVARMESWLATRVARRQVAPLIVPEFVKCALNLEDMEAFFDDWHRRLGWAVISGYSTGRGRREDLRVMCMAPPGRAPCRRLFSRMMILADGAVVACDQDHSASHVLGHLTDSPLGEIWSRGVSQLRAEHLAGRAAEHPLCAACDEWHRP